MVWWGHVRMHVIHAKQDIAICITVTCIKVKLALMLSAGPKDHNIRDQVANALNTIHILCRAMHVTCPTTRARHNNYYEKPEFSDAL